MKYYVSYTKDSVGNNYLAVKIPKEVVEPYLEEFKDLLDKKSAYDFETYSGNQKLRDHNEYHITVINVADYNRLAGEIGIREFIDSIELLFKYEIDDLEMLGIGTASKRNNTTYFVVCNSDKLDAIRERFNLSEQDFHITLGFSPKDVFGVRKNEIIKK